MISFNDVGSSLLVHIPAAGVYWCVVLLIQGCLLFSSNVVGGVYWCVDWLIQGCLLICCKVGRSSGSLDSIHEINL